MPVRTHTHPAARVYAQALLEVAGAQRREAIGAALDEFLRLLDDAPEIRVFLETPALDARAKKSALEPLRGRLGDVLTSFLCVVVEKKRADLLGQIGAAYGELLDREMNRARAQVTTAVALPDDLRERLRRDLGKGLSREVVLETEVDPDLVAGMVVQAGDRRVEASVHGWLERLRKEMVRSSGYED